MATSRLEKIGNIFTRVNGLLKSGAMKPEDKPMFFEIYKAFPPLKEPQFCSKVDSTLQVKPIFYPEDVDRASRDESMTMYNLNEAAPKRNESFTPSQQTQQQSAPSASNQKEEKIFYMSQLTDLKA